ncbi:hypothetical protein GALMADRAFT_134770 [Galerina marginata CBS 339.88]|uniref:Uncharacterized protein n=1 Tax=Galerina marginata (strain CBS 339.88) TaxID=685588 RepID=A0A067TJE3_GALM3|nr:hypothetical protein GALMADRAFT_134770 [Galerina marginata CBS 339.88]
MSFLFDAFSFVEADGFFLARNLSEGLNLSPEEGEKWIINLIREIRMGEDAKIDLKKVRLPLLFPLLFPFSFLPSPSVVSRIDTHILTFILQNMIEITRPQPVYQTVIEKTRQLVVRT